MTNREIARYFNRLANIMELHDENPFKIKSYANAYLALRKIEQPIESMSAAELGAIPGVGKTITEKIMELLRNGDLEAYQSYLDKTPSGVVDMLDIKGFGPKKIKAIWTELGIETVGELIYACAENRLVDLKGFGLKTQESLLKQLEYYVDSRGKYLYGNIEGEAFQLERNIMLHFSQQKVALVGDIRRMMPEVKGIDILISNTENEEIISKIDGLGYDEEGVLRYSGYPVQFHFTDPSDFGYVQFKMNSGPDFLSHILDIPGGDSEEEVFTQLGLSYVVPEYRESEASYLQAKDASLPILITNDDIKGVVHNHSTYSDGLHSLEDMAAECMRLGYEYLVISDHSKAAFYANGMKEETVMAQLEEIEVLNNRLNGFRIIKGIECDILNDGTLDYGDDFLGVFEVVIASIHSNLKMEISKSNQRLIKAIENKHTRILGHPTGRLLLSREGYPIDHKMIIDACAANGVVIELNANPLRLDLDWTWIPYALERGVVISINPDAHSKDQIKYIHNGVCAARKGGLTRDMCLNARGLEGFVKWMGNK